DLRRRGLSVTVLEARRRIGGRVMTVHDARVPIPIELGAEFIHGEAPVTEALLRRARLAGIDIVGEHPQFQGGALSRMSSDTSLERVLARIDRDAPDRPAAEFVAARPGGGSLLRARAGARRFLEGFLGADTRRLSAKSLAPQNGESAMASASRI